MDSLAAVLIALRSESGAVLWEDYCKDFFSSHYKEVDDFPFRQKLLHTFFSDLDNPDIVTRLVSLHIQADIDPVGMSNLQIMLKKLSEIHDMEKTIGSSTFVSSFQTSLQSPKEKIITLGGHTAVIIETLSEALSTAALKNSAALLVWQSSYRNIVR